MDRLREFACEGTTSGKTCMHAGRVGGGELSSPGLSRGQMQEAQLLPSCIRHAMRRLQGIRRVLVA